MSAPDEWARARRSGHLVGVVLGAAIGILLGVGLCAGGVL